MNDDTNPGGETAQTWPLPAAALAALTRGPALPGDLNTASWTETEARR